MGAGRWVAKCPAHEDTKPSLSVSQGEKGILLKCFAGCTLDSICTAIGIRQTDLFSDPVRIHDETNIDEGEILARHYWYGELLNALTLSPQHREELARRGLADDEIEKGGYRTFAKKEASGVRPGRPIPGWTEAHGWLPVSGILIPVLDPNGKIWAVCVKADSGPKYIWFSTGGLGKVFHYEVHAPGRPVYVVEGILKSRIALALGDLENVVGVGGTTNWRGFADWAIRQKKTHFVLAFDQDGNQQTGAELEKLRISLTDSGHKVSVLLWKGAKGLDDAIVDGITTKEVPWGNRDPKPRGLPGAAPDEYGGLSCRPLSRIQPREIEWLIPGWIPRGTFVKLDGDPGDGKGFVVCQLAALLSRGAGFAGCDSPRDKVNVVIINNEDDPECVTGPRLLAAGADENRVYVVSTGAEPFCLPKDIDRLSMLIDDTQASFVVLDPLPSFLDPTVNTIADKDVRSVMVMIADLAAKKKCAIMGVFHLNKSSESRAMYRSSGSVAFNGQARTAFMVLKDPTDSSRRYLWNFKNNWGKLLGHFAMEFETNPQGTQLKFLGRSEKPLDEILKGQGSASGGSTELEVEKWVMAMLKDGPMSVSEMELLSSRVGFPWAMVRKVAGLVCTTQNGMWTLKGWLDGGITAKDGSPSKDTFEGFPWIKVRENPPVPRRETV